MKKITAILIFILMLFTLLILPAAAETETEFFTDDSGIDTDDYSNREPEILAIGGGREKDFSRLMENNDYEYDWIVVVVDLDHPSLIGHPRDMEDFLLKETYDGVPLTDIEKIEGEGYDCYYYFRLYLENQTEDGVLGALKKLNDIHGIIYAEPHYDNPQYMNVSVAYADDNDYTYNTGEEDLTETAAPAEAPAPAETEAPAAQPPAPQPVTAPRTADGFAVTAAVLAAAVIACLCIGAAVLKKKGVK